MAGVISRGIQGPIIREGDDIVDIVVKSVYASEQADGYTLQNRDVIAVTESVVARAQGNYVTVDQVAQDIRAKFPAKKLGLVFPILSRNRFSMCLKAIARAMDEVVVLFSYPNDEVGNPLMVRSAYLKNRYSGVYDCEEADFVKTFGSPVHPFTGVTYLDFDREVIESEGAKAIGMTHFQTMTSVILPQALRNIMPQIGNNFIINVKDTSVMFIIGFTDFFSVHKAVAGASFKFFPSATIEMVGYLTMTLIASFLLRAIERRMAGKSNYELVQGDSLTSTAGTYNFTGKGSPYDEQSREKPQAQ